jgi:hypothetical protein
VTVHLRIPASMYEGLIAHLFPGDLDEHGAVILAGVAVREDRLTLLARELHLASEGDFVPGTFGYRQLSPLFVAETAGRADAQMLVYLSCHNHPGATTSVRFSSDDLRAHAHLFPHLLDLTQQAYVGGLVFGTDAVAGEIWFEGGTKHDLADTTIVGRRLVKLAPHRAGVTNELVDERFERQARLFGSEGQKVLREMHVGVIGAGGGGSLIIEQLAHLGVGRITAVDFDRVEATNLSRIVGATARDAEAATLKVEVARRVANQVDDSIAYRGIIGDLSESAVVDAVVECDFLFLATDTVRARLVFNAIAHQYLVPGIQIGSKVELSERGAIEEIYVAVRPVLADSGCLECAGLIDPFALQREQRTEEEAEAQNYIGAPGQDEVVDPSVISLNGIGASHAVTVMLLAATGLAADKALAHRIFFPRDGSTFTVEVEKRATCLVCSASERSVLGRGDARQLPVRPTVDLVELPPSGGTPGHPMSWIGSLLARLWPHPRVIEESRESAHRVASSRKGEPRKVA